MFWVPDLGFVVNPSTFWSRERISLCSDFDGLGDNFTEVKKFQPES